jgi:hypothetical protein
VEPSTTPDTGMQGKGAVIAICPYIRVRVTQHSTGAEQ